MEELLGLVVVLLTFILSAVSRNNKKKNKRAADKPDPVRQVASVQPVVPVQPTEPIAAQPHPAARQNLEAAFAAFSNLLDVDEKLPDPDGPAREKTAIEVDSAIKRRAEVIRARTLASTSGQSAVDEHGCIGGSMPNHNAEGEKQAEHAAHERERRQHLAAEAAVRRENLRHPTATELRNAVVMSEILDKPVSLRRRRI